MPFATAFGQKWGGGAYIISPWILGILAHKEGERGIFSSSSVKHSQNKLQVFSQGWVSLTTICNMKRGDDAGNPVGTVRKDETLWIRCCPEKGNVDKMSEKCPKIVRRHRKHIFWTFFAHLVAAFVWRPCPMLARYSLSCLAPHLTQKNTGEATATTTGSDGPCVNRRSWMATHHTFWWVFAKGLLSEGPFVLLQTCNSLQNLFRQAGIFQGTPTYQKQYA